jgi:CMP/dCMP kinase
LSAKSPVVEYQSIQKDMMARDKQDSRREVAPLKASVDALIIDSTGLSVDGVVEKIIQHMATKKSGDSLNHEEKRK